MQKFSFWYQIKGKGLQNNFGSKVNQSVEKIQNGRQIQNGGQFRVFFALRPNFYPM